MKASDVWQFAGVALPWIRALRRPCRAFAGCLCAADAKALADQDGCAGPQIGPLNSAPVAGGCSHLPAGYDGDDPLAPPNRIFAERTGGIELRLRIDEWSSLSSGDGAP